MSRHLLQSWLGLTFACCLASLLLGCERTPVKSALYHFDEPLRQADIELFIDVAKSIPESKLLSNITPYLPAPQWDSDRTLPVRDLVSGELQTLDERWQLCAQGQRPVQSKAIERVLKRKHISRERFASLAFAIGIAASRDAIPSDLDFNWHLKKAQFIMMELRKDGRPFHSLTPEAGHDVLRRASWLTEYHRGERLSHVPPYNAIIARHYRDQLTPLLPPEFFANPLNMNLDRNIDRAMPFEELPGNESLELLNWDPTTAISASDEIDAKKLH